MRNWFLHMSCTFLKKCATLLVFETGTPFNPCHLSQIRMYLETFCARYIRIRERYMGRRE
jgi:hypothetical protein